MAEIPRVAELFDLWPCGLAHLDGAGAFVSCNVAFEEMSGWPAHQLIGKKHFSEVLSLAGRLFYETQVIQQLKLEGSIAEVALELLKKDGSTVPVFVNARTQGTTQGDVYLAVFAAPERRRFESELLAGRRNADRLAELIKHSQDAVLTVSPEDIVEGWNDGATALFGYARQEALGRDLKDFIVPAEQRQEFLSQREKLRAGQHVRFEMKAVGKDGRPTEVGVTLTPHIEPPGRLVAYSAVLRDETERNLAREALMRSEKIAVLGRMASSIAHEINNPLEAVTNLLYILHSQVDADSVQFVELAQAELSRVAQVVTHTLRFHRQSSMKTAVQMPSVLDSLLAVYKGRIANKQIEVVREYQESAPLFCHEGEMRQVFANLLGNALDAMNIGGRLRLRVRDACDLRNGRSGLAVTVADNGHGICASDRSKLFQPFYSTKGIGGTGLGLWLSMEMVRKQEGTISFRSSMRAAESGTVFKVFLPHGAADAGA